MILYYQCRLKRNGATLRAWIEHRGAIAGKTVELKPTGELWRVCEVFQPPMEEKMLKEHQLLNRGSLPSVERMK